MDWPKHPMVVLNENSTFYLVGRVSIITFGCNKDGGGIWIPGKHDNQTKPTQCQILSYLYIVSRTEKLISLRGGTIYLYFTLPRLTYMVQ